jgi:hypothetical protein
MYRYCALYIIITAAKYLSAPEIFLRVRECCWAIGLAKQRNGKYVLTKQCNGKYVLFYGTENALVPYNIWGESAKNHIRSCRVGPYEYKVFENPFGNGNHFKRFAIRMVEMKNHYQVRRCGTKVYRMFARSAICATCLGIREQL